MKHRALLLAGLISLGVVSNFPLSTRAADAPAKAAADAYPVGARVEARRNNQWLPATIVKREGTRAFVKFDGASDSFNEWVESTQLREASVVTATGPTTPAPPAGATPTTPAGATPATKPGPKAPADPFAVGTEIEALWHGKWTDTTVLARNGPKADVMFMNAFKETVGPTEMRVRGVTADEAAKLSSQTGLFATGAKVEYKWGGNWYDGVILRRNATEVEIQTTQGTKHRTSPAELRTRAVAPPPPAAVAAAGAGAQTAPPTAPATDAFAIGAKIEVLWGSQWYKSTVMKREGAKAFIHYDGEAGAFDEWVTPDRMRAIGGAVATGSPTAVQRTSPAAPAAPAIPAADQSAMLTLKPDTLGGHAKPDPCTEPTAPIVAAKPIFLPPMTRAGKPVQGRVIRVQLTAGTAHGFIEYLVVGAKTQAQICKIDLAAGTVGPGIDLPDGMVPADMSPDGKRLLLRRGGAGANLVEVWSIEPKPGQPMPWKVKEFQPFGGGGNNAVNWAAFVDSDHVVCTIHGGNMILVDVNSLKAIWTIDGLASCVGGVSPGRNLVACATLSGACLIEPLTGRVVQVLDGRLPWSTALAFSFSPDGKRLAAVGAGTLFAWDLEAQDSAREIALANPYTHRVDWLTDNELIVGGTKLVDLEKRIVLWHYLHPEGEPKHSISCAAGGKFWYLTEERIADAARRQFNPITLPLDEPARAIAALKPEELYVVHPGSKVSLQVNVGADADEQAKIVAGITASLKRAGLEVADGQPVTVNASASAGESKQLSFRSFGIGPPQETTVTTTPTNLELSIVADGKTAWSIKGVTGVVFGMVTVKQGQSPQDAVNEAQKPRFNFFYNPQIPSYVTVPREKEGFGESNLTARGLQPVSAAP